MGFTKRMSGILQAVAAWECDLGNGCYSAYNAADTARLEQALASSLDKVKVCGNKCWVDLRTMKQRNYDPLAGFLRDVRRTELAPLEPHWQLLQMEEGLELPPLCPNTPPVRVPPLPPPFAPHRKGGAGGAAAGGERGNRGVAKTDQGDGLDSVQGTPVGVSREAGADGTRDSCADCKGKDMPVGTDPGSGPVHTGPTLKFCNREDTVPVAEFQQLLDSKGSLHKMTWAEPLDSNDPCWRAVNSTAKKEGHFQHSDLKAQKQVNDVDQVPFPPWHNTAL